MRDENYIIYIVDTYMKLLLRIAYSYLKNTEDAEDAVQEVFLKLLDKQMDFSNTNLERAWLIRVTINLCLDYLKAAHRKNVPLEEGWNGKKIEENPVLEEILNLPERYKTPVYLHYVEGYSIKEIAGFLGKPEATVGTWMARGRKLLKKSLEDV